MTITFLLWLADVARALTTTMFIVGAVATIVGAFSVAAYYFANGMYMELMRDNRQGAASEMRDWVKLWEALRKCFIPGLALLAAACFLPSASTIYALTAPHIENAVTRDWVQGKLK